MSRPIDADVLIGRFESLANDDWNKETGTTWANAFEESANMVDDAPTVDAVPVVRCRDCKHWRRQTNYAGAQLSFGFCESDDMWGSLYGETYEVSHIDTDDDFYCGYAERREDGKQ